MKIEVLRALLVFGGLSVICSGYSNESVDVHLNVSRTVGGVSEFDRSKFMVLHSSLGEPDWQGEEDKLEYVLNELDVYLGRDNGGIGWYYNQSRADPSKPGFVDPSYMATTGATVRSENYGQNLDHLHKYEDRVDMIIGAQYFPFWPGSQTNPCCGGTPWGPTTAEGSGNYMGQYLQEFFRDSDEAPTEGQKRPRFIEIMNEPLYEFVTTGNETPLDVFEYHNAAATAIRAVDPDVLIGGYATAFPYFDERDFERWHERYKLFMDTAAENMDFLSLHFYDFDEHGVSGGGTTGPWNFKGGRIEATLDMVEQYSDLSFGFVKPLFISEYGGRNHRLEGQPWTPERDWAIVKSFSPLMMSFMDRPDQILKAIPFALVKAEWSETTYVWRLMRQKKEAEGETGEEWVFTDIIKFFELWSDVKGKRVHSRASDPDLLIDAYVDGTHAYVIVSNLETEVKELDLSLLGEFEGSLVDVKTKQLQANGCIPILVEENMALDVETFRLESEATMIVEYTFEEAVSIDETLSETKYYSDTYLKEIVADQTLEFGIDGIEKNGYGNATLRIGLGRDHGKSLRPIVTFNGTDIAVPSDHQGDEQTSRANFFGLVEVPVPYHLISESNDIELRFLDDGGRVSSVTLRCFESSLRLNNMLESMALVESVVADDNEITVHLHEGTPRGMYTVMKTDDLAAAIPNWNVDTKNQRFDEGGRGLYKGQVKNGSQFFTIVECPECLPLPGPPESVKLDQESLLLVEGGRQKLQVELHPSNTNDRSIVWESSDDSIATVDEFGYVTGVSIGNCEVKARSVSGGVFDSCDVNVIEGLQAVGIEFDDQSKYTGVEFMVGEDLDVRCIFNAGDGSSVSATSGGVRVLLRELRSDWTVVDDISVSDSSTIGINKGVSDLSISLQGLTASIDLPSGHFYYLFATFSSSNGDTYSEGVSPVTLIASP